MNRASKQLLGILLTAAAAIVLFSSSAKAGELINIADALKKIFPKADKFQDRRVTLTAEQIGDIEESAELTFAGAHSDTLTVYTAIRNQELVGYAFEDTVFGKWGPIHYLVGTNIQGAVIEVVVLDYQEVRGKPVAKRRFLQQYRGKTTTDPLQVRQDINGITGATISSRSMTEGVRKILHTFNEIIDLN